MVNHRKEPWHQGDGVLNYVIYDEDGHGVAACRLTGTMQEGAAIARRIVACVNACVRLPTKALEKSEIARAVGNGLLEKEARIAQLEAQLSNELAVIAKKNELMAECIENNLHLADGDICTLKLIKDALAIGGRDFEMIQVGYVDSTTRPQAYIEFTDSVPNDGTKLYKLEKRVNDETSN